MPDAVERSTAHPPGSRAQTPLSYISALSEALESPGHQDVYNLAATLTTPAAAAADDTASPDADELSFPQHLHAARDRDRDFAHGRLERQRLRALERERSDTESRERSDRLRRVMNRLGAAYGDRIPHSNTLFDWSPAHEADDEEELDQILAELRREQPHTHPDTLHLLGRSRLESERERSRATISRLLSSNQPSQSADSSLRSAAILQSVRRHPRFSARTRDYLQRHSADRESTGRSPHASDWRDRYGPSETSRQAAAMQRIAERRTSLDQARDPARSQAQDTQGRAESYRRGYVDRAANSSSTASPMLEQTVKYLSRIRHANTLDDSLDYAIDAGFLGKDYFTADQQDFLLDPFLIARPAESSWLAPGAVLSGCQHATTITSTVTTAGTGTGTGTGISTTLYRFRNNDTMTSTLFEPSGRLWLNQSYSSPRSRGSPSQGPEVVTHGPQQDKWPVKVTIHSVDYDRMSLSATMEAYNVPSHPHQHQSLLGGAADGTTPNFTRTSSITTYLEGEILDFNTHTLLTESFKSSASNDATYWRKLPPFQMLTDEEMVQKLTSRQWFNEVLSREWILMRWKERCFVKSLNRSTNDPAHPTASTAPAVSSHDPLRTTTRDNGHGDSGSTHYWGSTGDVEQGSFDDSGCGLTISGFYYVCLRRSDGKLEGLYYDPQSSPYQCLKLESVRGGVFPAWEFR